MAKAHLGAFKPLNSLDGPRHDVRARVNAAPRDRRRGNYENPHAQHPLTSDGHENRVRSARPTSVEPPRKKQKSTHPGDILYVSDSEGEGAGNRSLDVEEIAATSPKGRKRNAHTKRQDFQTPLDSRNEFQAVETMMNPRSLQMRESARSSDMKSEAIINRPTSNQQQHMTTPASSDRLDNNRSLRQERKTERSKPEGGHGLKALDELLEQVAQVVPPPKVNLRDTFKRDSGEEDELHYAKPLNKISTHISRKQAHTGGKVAQNIRQASIPRSDIPQTDITPSRFRSSAKTEIETQKSDDAHSYKLLFYRSRGNMRSAGESLRIEADGKSPLWVIKSSKTTLPIDLNEIRKGWLPDLNNKQALFVGEASKDYHAPWHHLVFTDAEQAFKFRLDQLSCLNEGTKIDESTDTQLENDLVPQAEKGSILVSKPVRQSAARRSHDRQKYSTKQPVYLEKLPSAKPAKRLSSARRNSDDIVYEISPEKPTIRRSIRTSGRVQHADERDSPEVRERSGSLAAPTNSKHRRHQPPPDLGPPWQKSLVFPRRGPSKATVEFDDLQRLNHDDFLNDNLVAFCLNYARNLSPEQSKRVYFFNTFFYEQLTKNTSRGKINFEAVKRWTAKANLFSHAYDHIVIPINEDAHWYAAIICNVPGLIGDMTFSPDKGGVATPDKNRDSSALVVDVGPDFEKLNSPDGDLATGTHQMSLEDLENPNLTAETGTADQEDFSGGKQGDGGGLADIESAEHHESEVVSAKTSKRLQSEDEDPSRNGGPKKRLTINGRRKWDSEEPTILVLDSLGAAHRTLGNNLRQYLAAEAKDKRSCEIQEPKTKLDKTLPGQHNFYDCGVYLVGYIARFLEDPNGFIEKMANQELADDKAWENLDPQRMRENIRSIILNEYAQQVMEQPQNSKARKEAATLKTPPKQPPGKTAYERFTAPLELSPSTPEAEMEDLVSQPEVSKPTKGVAESAMSSATPSRASPDTHMSSSGAEADNGVSTKKPKPSLERLSLYFMSNGSPPADTPSSSTIPCGTGNGRPMYNPATPLPKIRTSQNTGTFKVPSSEADEGQPNGERKSLTFTNDWYSELSDWANSPGKDPAFARRNHSLHAHGMLDVSQVLTKDELNGAMKQKVKVVEEAIDKHRGPDKLQESIYPNDHVTSIVSNKVDGGDSEIEMFNDSDRDRGDVVEEVEWNGFEKST